MRVASTTDGTDAGSSSPPLRLEDRKTDDERTLEAMSEAKTDDRLFLCCLKCSSPGVFCWLLCGRCHFVLLAPYRCWPVKIYLVPFGCSSLNARVRAALSFCCLSLLLYLTVHGFIITW
jgi:hypothetical protein